MYRQCSLGKREHNDECRKKIGELLTISLTDVLVKQFTLANIVLHKSPCSKAVTSVFGQGGLTVNDIYIPLRKIHHGNICEGKLASVDAA